MKKLILLASLVIALAARGEVQGFVRPLVSVIQPYTEGSTSATGIGAVGGLYIGAKGQHEISLETDYTSWSFDTGTGAGRVRGDAYYQLVAVNYRYHFVFPSVEKLSIYAGPSLGFVFTTVEARASGFGSSNTTRTSSSASWGVSAGATYRITSLIDVDVGYRAQYVAGTTNNLSGYNYTTPGTSLVTQRRNALALSLRL